MLIIDCSEYGPVGPWIGDATQATEIMDFAQHMLEVHPVEWLLKWAADWEMALAWESIMEESVGDSWYGRCLLVQAVMGLLGKRLPKVQVISN